MKTFVVRVYRQCADRGEDLAGLVDHVEDNRQTPFRTFEELREILLGAPESEAIGGQAPKQRKKSGVEKKIP